MKHCPRAVSITRPSTLQPTALPSELAAAPLTLVKHRTIMNLFIGTERVHHNLLHKHLRMEIFGCDFNKQKYLKKEDWEEECKDGQKSHIFADL